VYEKILALTTITICALPVLALASYNDVTLDSNAVIQVGSYTLNVSGTSATLQSITVNDNATLSVTLASGSSITVSSPALYELSSDIQTDVTSTVCSNATSSISLAYSGAGTVTNTITPSSTSCSTDLPGAPMSVSASAGNGQATVSFSAPSQDGSPITSYTVTSSPGGIIGSGASSPVTVTGLSNGTAYSFTVTATNSSGAGAASSASNSITPTTPPSEGGVGSISSGSSGGPVSQAVLNSLLATSTASSTQNIPGCPTGYVCKVIPGFVASSTNSKIPAFAGMMNIVFTHDLTIGSQGNDVKNLQVFLNTLGFVVAQSGNGSPNHESTYFGSLTQKALIKFQKANNIKPAAGYFGPITRSLINGQGSTINGQGNTGTNPSLAPSSTAVSTSINFTRDLTVGSQGNDVKALQEYLNNHSFTVASSGAGSPGNESTYFGPATQTALIKFQTAKNIVPASGYFGAKTRTFVNGQ
jgi:hypothetical protein